MTDVATPLSQPLARPLPARNRGTNPCYAPGPLLASKPGLLLVSGQVSRSGEVFLWPIRLTDPFGRPDYWSLTAREAVETAKTRWTRNTSDMNRGRYRVYTSGVDLAPVQWPSLSPEEIIELAFGDRMIEDIDHPILRRLRGEL
jgi:hypothetical protein